MAIIIRRILELRATLGTNVALGMSDWVDDYEFENIVASNVFFSIPTFNQFNLV